MQDLSKRFFRQLHREFFDPSRPSDFATGLWFLWRYAHSTSVWVRIGLAASGADHNARRSVDLVIQRRRSRK